MPKYLGLDSSTQSFSAVVIDTEINEVIYEESVSFGSDLPEFNCPDGFLTNSDSLIKHSDPLLWVQAFEMLFAKMKNNGFDFSQIDSVSGSGQQHGTVYLNNNFLESSNWNETKPLVENIKTMLSRKTAPIWMDSSTSIECEEITNAVGGRSIVQAKSGSPAIERFSASQIRKFYKETPDLYEKTAVIHLVSSFLASLLCGRSVPIDFGDASGMNLLNLSECQWDETLLNATSPRLLDKLPKLVPSDSVIGVVSSYLVKKYGFRDGAQVIAWSGDNPNSIVGVGATEAGNAVISLGTSDTFFASMNESVVDPNGYGHVFCNPAGGYMCLICFKNGSLARENIKEEFDLTWEEFDKRAFEETTHGNNGNLMLPFSKEGRVFW